MNVEAGGPPFSMVGIDHVVFLVDDMAKGPGLYGNVLGCVIGYSYPKLGMEQVWAGAALIVLWDITQPGAVNAIPPVAGGRNIDHVCIALSPFDEDAMRRHLRPPPPSPWVFVCRPPRGGFNFFSTPAPFGKEGGGKGPGGYKGGGLLG